MSEQVVIDGLDFARNARVLHGKIKVASLVRVQDHLAGKEVELEYSVAGGLNADGKPVLHVLITGILPLQCQRCLGRMDYTLDLDSKLVLVESDRHLAAVEDEWEAVGDSIVGGPDLDVLALLEDEIILGLPISPRHSAGECNLLTDAETDKSPNAFAVLNTLKTRR